MPIILLVILENLLIFERLCFFCVLSNFYFRAVDKSGQSWAKQAHKPFHTNESYISIVEKSSKSDLKDLLSELDLLKKLKPHPNVIRLLGCVTKDVVRCREKMEFSKFMLKKR